MCYSRVKLYIDPMQIGELSKKTGLTIDAVRFYEKEGLVRPPKRSEGGYRLYSPEAALALKFISHCRSLDIPLAEIKKLLRVRDGSARSCRDANEVIDKHLSSLRTRIKNLKALEKSLAQLRSVCSEELNPLDCRIIKNLESV